MVVLSDEQFEALKIFISQTIEETIDEKELVTKADLSFLPTQDNILDLIKEIRDLREEISAHNSQVSRNTDRLEKLEKIHPDYQHQ